MDKMEQIGNEQNKVSAYLFGLARTSKMRYIINAPLNKCEMSTD